MSVSAAAAAPAAPDDAPPLTPADRRRALDAADDAGKVAMMAVALLQLSRANPTGRVEYPELVAWGFHVSEVERLRPAARAQARRILDDAGLTRETVA